MLAILLFLLFASTIWLAALVFLGWRLLRDEDCEPCRNLSVSELVGQEQQRRWFWCSLKAWLAAKPLRLTYQPMPVRLRRCREVVRPRQQRGRKAP